MTAFIYTAAVVCTILTVWLAILLLGHVLEARRKSKIVRRWRGEVDRRWASPWSRTLLLALALLLPLAGGCASTGDPQMQQFQAQLGFWTGEVARLRALAETLPPGKDRDKAVKDLAQAQFWLSYANALVNPPVPTTQPVKPV